MAGRKLTRGKLKKENKASFLKAPTPESKARAVEKLFGGLPALNLSDDEKAFSMVGMETINAVAIGEKVGIDCLHRWEKSRARLQLFLVALSENGWAAALNAASLTHTHTSLLAVVDPDGFGALLSAAQKIWDEKCQRRATDELYRRAVDGVDEPVFGRVGVGEDGVIGKKRVYSDRLLALAVERRDPGFKKQESGVKVSIGQQVVYNLGDLKQAVAVDVDAVDDAELEESY